MGPVESACLEMRRRTLHHDIFMQAGQSLFRITFREQAQQVTHCDMLRITHLLSTGVVLLETSWYTMIWILTPSFAFLSSNLSMRYLPLSGRRS